MNAQRPKRKNLATAAARLATFRANAHQLVVVWEAVTVAEWEAEAAGAKNATSAAKLAISLEIATKVEDTAEAATEAATEVVMVVVVDTVDVEEVAWAVRLATRAEATDTCREIAPKARSATIVSSKDKVEDA